MTASAHSTDMELAQMIWDFNVEIDAVEKADIVIALGSHDLRVADRAAQLYHSKMAPLILCSGGFGRLTDKLWTQPEAQQFANRVVSLGVPKECVLIEDKSTNTGENITFSKALLAQRNIHSKRVILVHKPYMLRRAWATGKKHLPESELFTTAPQFDMHDYPNDTISQSDMINIMVGDLQRLLLYPARGFQVAVAIPAEVLAAYDELLKRGYTQQLIIDR